MEPYEVSNIPYEAYTLPDVDGLMRITLYNENDTTPISYVEKAISNTKTFRHKTFKLSTVGLLFSMTILVGGVCVLEVFHSSMTSDVLHRLAILIFWFQFMGHTGALSLPFPAIYFAFVRNFAWTLGLVSNLELQHLSMWITSSDLIEDRETQHDEVLEAWIGDSVQPTITDQLTRFVRSLNIPEYHAFPTVFQVVLFTVLGLCSLFTLLWLLIEIMYRRSLNKRSVLRRKVRKLTVSVLLHFILSLISSMVIFSIYEFMLKDITSAGLTLAIVTVLVLSLVLGYTTIKLIITGVKTPAERAEDGSQMIFSVLSERYEDRFWWYIFIIGGHELTYAILLTFGQTYGTVPNICSDWQ